MSKYFSLNQLDIMKAALLAAIVASLTSLLDIFSNGGLPTLNQLKAAGIIAGTSFISYLIKNLITNSIGQLGAKEPVVVIPVSEIPVKAV